jgi:hypothetical protein
MIPVTPFGSHGFAGFCGVLALLSGIFIGGFGVQKQ